MDHISAYDFGEAFARLTGVLEDVAGLAADGQSSQLNGRPRRRLATIVEAGLIDATTILKEIQAKLR